MEKGLLSFFGKVREEVEKSRFYTLFSEEGKVLSVGDGIVQISGLKDAKLYEIIELEGGDEGIVFDLGTHSMGVVLLTEKNAPGAGERVSEIEKIESEKVGESLLGRGVDALGGPI